MSTEALRYSSQRRKRSVRKRPRPHGVPSSHCGSRAAAPESNRTGTFQETSSKSALELLPLEETSSSSAESSSESSSHHRKRKAKSTKKKAARREVARENSGDRPVNPPVSMQVEYRVWAHPPSEVPQLAQLHQSYGELRENDGKLQTIVLEDGSVVSVLPTTIRSLGASAASSSKKAPSGDEEMMQLLNSVKLAKAQKLSVEEQQ